MSSPRYWFIVLLVYESDVGEIRLVQSRDGGNAVSEDLALGYYSAGGADIADGHVFVEKTGRHDGGLAGAGLDGEYHDVAIRESTIGAASDGEGVFTLVVATADAGYFGELGSL